MKNFLMFFLLIQFTLKAEVILSEPREIANTLNFIFMADTQIQNILAPPHFYRSLFFDKLLEIAVRPPHLDLYSVDFIKWTLSEYGEGKKIIFLGDALNIGCKNEWTKFRGSMEQFKTHSGWVMAPGNHDAFFYGNSNGSRSNERGVSKKWWAKACLEGLDQKIPDRIKDVVMAKDDLIRNYLEVLFDQNKTNPEDFPIAKKEILCKSNDSINDCEWISTNEESFLQKLFYSMPESDEINESYKAIIVQEINLGEKLKGIMLDTSDYEDAPTLLIGALNNGRERNLSRSFNAGLKGSLQSRQIEVIKKWMIGKEDTFFLLMGHHPLEALSEKSVRLLTEVKKIHPKLAYMSAHTHTGFLNLKGVVPEINIGSMIDWNPGFVTLGSDLKDGNLNLEVKRTHFDEELLNCNPSDNLENYTDYKKIKNGSRARVFEFTMDIISESYQKAYAALGGMLEKSNDQLFCSKRDKGCLEKKFSLAKESLDFDLQNQNDWQFFKKRISYGACQAFWASKAEHELSKKK